MSEAKAPAPKRVALNMKATPALRGRIDAAAAASGLSVAQEVERRLIASLNEDDRHGGSHNSAFIGLFSSIIQLAEQRAGSRWSQNYSTWVAVRDATLAVLEASKPNAPGYEDAENAADRYADELENWMPADKRLDIPRLPKNWKLGQDVDADIARLTALKDDMRNAGERPRAAHLAGAELGKTIASELLSPEPKK